MNPEMMTPLTRIVPTGSSAQRRPAEHESSRLVSGPGTGAMPPMRPAPSNMEPGLTPLPQMVGGVGGGGSSADLQGDEIVNDILRDVERGRRGNDSVMGGEYQQQQAPQYAPQYTTQPPLPSPAHFQETPRYDYREEAPPEYLRPPPSSRRYADDDDSFQGGKSRDEKEGDGGLFDGDFLQMMLREIRLPLVVAILILLMGVSQADDMLGKFIPSLLVEGRLSYGGLIAKAVVGGLLYYAVQRIFL